MPTPQEIVRAINLSGPHPERYAFESPPSVPPPAAESVAPPAPIAPAASGAPPAPQGLPPISAPTKWRNSPVQQALLQKINEARALNLDASGYEQFLYSPSDVPVEMAYKGLMDQMWAYQRSVRAGQSEWLKSKYPDIYKAYIDENRRVYGGDVHPQADEVFATMVATSARPPDSEGIGASFPGLAKYLPKIEAEYPGFTNWATKLQRQPAPSTVKLGVSLAANPSSGDANPPMREPVTRDGADFGGGETGLRTEPTIGVPYTPKATVTEEQFTELQRVADDPYQSFEAYKRMGLIPTDSYFAPDPKDPTKWGYFTAEQAAAIRKEAAANAQSNIERAKYADWSAEELVSGKMVDGAWTPSPWGVHGSTYISPPDWAKEQIGLGQNAALQTISAIPGVKVGNKYRIDNAIAGGADHATLRMAGFKQVDIDEAQKLVDAGKSEAQLAAARADILGRLAPYTSMVFDARTSGKSTNVINAWAALEDNAVTREELAKLNISPEAIGMSVDRKQAIPLPEGYGKPTKIIDRWHTEGIPFALGPAAAKLVGPEGARGVRPIEAATSVAQAGIVVATAGGAELVAPTVLTAARYITAGIFGADAVDNWKYNTPAGRILSVAIPLSMFTPEIISAAKGAGVTGIKFSKVVLPTNSGDIVVWRGMDVNGVPIVGISGGHPAVGKLGIVYPEGAAISADFKPITLVDTNILASKAAMTKLGFSDSEIAKVQATLSNTRSFRGMKSQYISKVNEPEPIKALNRDSVAATLKHVVDSKDDVDMVYGSSTIKSQIEPSLRGWREPADIDIQTRMGETETEQFAADLADKLKATEGASNVRIAEGKPTLIETFSAKDNSWHHAVDIHSKAVDPASISSEIDPAAGYGYVGDRLTRPAIEINYPGIGKIRIMRLSESGVRKAVAILHWQPTDDYIVALRKQGISEETINDIVSGGSRTIAPAAHRIKDITDYYVILRTFKGQAAADEWALKYGYDPGELSALGSADPPKLVSWKFDPTRASAGIGDAAPSVALVGVSSAIAAPVVSDVVSPDGGIESMSVSPEVAASLDSGYGVDTPSMQVTSADASRFVSGYASVPAQASVGAYPATTPSMSSGVTSIGATDAAPLSAPINVSSRPASAVVSLAGPASGSVAAVSSPRMPPSPPSTLPPSPHALPSPSPYPSGSVSPPIKPVPPPSPHVPPPIPLLPKLTKHGGSSVLREPATVTWYQGERPAGPGKSVPVWYVLRSPFQSSADAFEVSSPPPGATVVTGKRAAYKTIKLLSGEPPNLVLARMGVMHITIRRPSTVAGRSGAIQFTSDPEHSLDADIDLAQATPVSKAGLRKVLAPRHSRKRVKQADAMIFSSL